MSGDLGDGLPAYVSGTPQLAVVPRTTWPASGGGRDVAGRGSTRSGGTASCTATSTPRTCSSTPTPSTSTGLLDWEFAHAGHPYSDLGNLLRFDRHPAFEESVLAAYCARRGGIPADALELGRAADLWALVELATRRGQNPVADRAHELLLRIAQTLSVHA